MAKYIDSNGFAHFLGKLKTLLDGKVSVVSGKGLSANDFSDTYKNKLDGIDNNANNYSLPIAASGTLGGIKVGSGLSINSSTGVLSADVQAVPAASANNAGTMSASDYSKLAAFGSASDYALKTDITSMYKHKGSVSAVANLPTTGQTNGDVYNVTTTGMNYVWTGTEWDALGEIFTIEAMTTTEIDSAFTTAGLSAA